MYAASAVLLLACSVSGEIFFQETFDNADKWVQSTKKSDLGKFELATGETYGDKAINQGLQTSQDAKFYAMSAKIDKPFVNKDKPLVVSFTVKHDQGIDCGGGYLKIMPEVPLTEFDGESPYYMMFGPDICGMTKKIHLIFGFKGENLLWKKEPRAEDDTLTHVYTVIVNPDETYEVQVDGEKKESGKLADDWQFMKDKEIDDPEDKKPEDWVEEAQIADPEDKKPEGWDDIPEEIVDPKAEKPEDWDEEDDGEWEAPTIKNPEYKGEWKPKMIANPAYKGVWAPKKIANPEFVEEKDVHLAQKPLAAVGIDIWQVKSGTVFDNIIIADDVAEVTAFVEKTWGATHKAEKEMKEKVDAEKQAEAAKKAAEAEKAQAEKKAAEKESESDEDESEGDE